MYELTEEQKTKIENLSMKDILKEKKKLKEYLLSLVKARDLCVTEKKSLGLSFSESLGNNPIYLILTDKFQEIIDGVSGQIASLEEAITRFDTVIEYKKNSAITSNDG
jgi:hypothetical protein